MARQFRRLLCLWSLLRGWDLRDRSARTLAVCAVSQLDNLAYRSQVACRCRHSEELVQLPCELRTSKPFRGVKVEHVFAKSDRFTLSSHFFQRGSTARHMGQEYNVKSLWLCVGIRVGIEDTSEIGKFQGLHQRSEPKAPLHGPSNPLGELDGRRWRVNCVNQVPCLNIGLQISETDVAQSFTQLLHGKSACPTHIYPTKQ
mmetsp:Transcript_43155/g.101579  ORF Transcript_43155/g.101579 Transcript_43155/m.101579 type:complete len:201 (+) Transcript_43155:258-860(+)